MAPKRRPTSHDVARAAGVSRATVSYVLNDVTRQRISPEVQKRVWKAVGELHYTPDHHARMLKTKESDIVLIVMVGATPGPLLMQATDNLTRRVAAAGYTPLIDFTGTPSPTAFSRACDRIQPVAVVAPGALLSPRIAKAAGAERNPLCTRRRGRSRQVDRPSSVSRPRRSERSRRSS